MKKLFFVLVALLLFGFTACSDHQEYEDDPIDGGDIGGDWHVWGLYDFMQLGELDIVIDQVNDETPQHIGYDIYRDGDSLGELLCEIRCTDGGYAPEDMAHSDGLLFEDHNSDGLDDIGAPLKNGDVMWYLQDDNFCFTYSETQKAADN